MTGKSESWIVNEGFKNDGKFETPGKTGKADQRKKWSHKEPWPDAFSEDHHHQPINVATAGAQAFTVDGIENGDWAMTHHADPVRIGGC
ncbi:hypothetical protein evm_009707 [Chilo suppressalis]|nr:hypothetical protein evm_009707 [Chilo suppressalis]